MAVLDLAAGLGHVVHAGAAEVVELGEGFALVVTFLVGGGEEGIFVSNYVVLQFSHGLELQAGGGFEGFLGPHEGGVRSAVEGLPGLVKEAAEKAQRGNFAKWIYESGAVAGYYIEVTVACFDERGEEAGSVYSFAFREDGLCILKAVDGEIQRFDPSVFGGVHEVNHADAFFAYEMQQVLSGKILGALLEEGNDLVRVKCY